MGGDGSWYGEGQSGLGAFAGVLVLLLRLERLRLVVFMAEKSSDSLLSISSGLHHFLVVMGSLQLDAQLALLSLEWKL